MRLKRFVLLVVIIIIIVLLFKYPFKKDVPIDKTETKLIDETVISDEENLKDENLTKFGDLLSMDYVLKIKKTGEVVDTNNPELAKQYNITNYVKGHYSFILGNSDKLKEKVFDKAVIGWKVGEEKTVDIAPTEKELYVKINRDKESNLYFAIPRYQGLPLKSFQKLFNEEPVVGKTVSNPDYPWSFKIVEITENNAVGDPVIKERDKIKLKDVAWPVVVDAIFEKVIQFKHTPEKKIYETEFGLAEVSTTDEKINIRYNPKEGDMIDYFFGAGMVKMPGKFKIVDIAEDQFKLFRTDNINDKWLTLEAKLLERIPDVKEVREKSIPKKTKVTAVRR